MTLMRWDPLRELETMRENMDRLMERFFEGRTVGEGGVEASAVALAVDIWETADSITIQASVPGVKPEDLDIRVEGNILTIRGQTQGERETKAENYLRRERRFGRFYRQVALSALVQADKAEAHFENGVVTITLPKAEQARPKQIPVRATQERRGEQAA